MPMTDFNADHIRAMQEQLAEVLIHKLVPPRAEIPAPLKWAGGIVAALFTMGGAGLAFWLVTTVNQMQLTLTRVDTQLTTSAADRDRRFDEFDRRITKLENYHAPATTGEPAP